MFDLKFAFRMLLKKPGFTVIAILTIGLSIAANTTVYSWIKATLINVLPGAKDQQQLVVICPRHESGKLVDTCSYLDLQDFQKLTNVFSGVIASQVGIINIRTGDSYHWLWAQRRNYRPDGNNRRAVQCRGQCGDQRSCMYW